MTRTIPAVLVALSLVLAAEASAARNRSVRPAGPQCSFSLSPTFAATVPSAGLTQAPLHVIASPSTCTSWNAYSLTDWVVVTRSGNAVNVDVAPNPVNTPRTATILVAGIRYSFSQEGSPVISPPIVPGNVLENGGFDADLAFWGFQDRFPNGPGNASWSSTDANGNPNSGSIRLRNTRPVDQSHTFQQLQCVAVDAGQIYEYGGKFFAGSAEAGTAMWGIVEYADDDCNVAAILAETQVPRSRTPGTWQSHTFTKRMSGSARSAFVVIGSRATEPGTFEILMDDIFLRKR
jgi:hypothetical protein